MTEPNENTAIRPISVAELLARNGSIGSPAPSGRRRRRRGNADAVTVAELTGEMPIITLDEPPVVEEAPEVEEAPVEPEVELHAPESDYEAHLQHRDVEPEPLEFTARRRAHVLSRRTVHPPAGGAEEMTFDSTHGDEDDADADEIARAVKARPSYLRSPTDALFGGDSVADDVARRGRTPGPEDIDLGGTQKVAIALGGPIEEVDTAESSVPSTFTRGMWIVAQSILAVALGAGLFVAFDQLWKWNNIVALALSVLVILGLVVGVRVVRKTEDIASTLIAVAVGAMVTLGPLALLQST